MSVSIFSTEVPVREAALELAGLYQELLRSMCKGTIPAPENPAWADPRFHRMIVSALGKVGSVRADAEKWGAMKELFREIGRA